MDLQQVLEVFTDPAQAPLHDRQAAVMRRMTRECADGFRYRQLPIVCQLLEAIWQQIDGQKAMQFVPHLNELLGLCGLPVSREKSNEEFLGGLENFEGLVGTMERFLHVPVHSVQIATCKALQEIALGRDAMRTNTPVTLRVLGAGEVKEDLRPIPRDLNQGLLLKTGVVAGLASEIQAQVGAFASIAGIDAAGQGGGGESGEGGAAATAAGGGGAKSPMASTSIAEPGGLVRAQQEADDSDDDFDEEGGGGGGRRGGEDVLLKSTTLSAELVSTMPADLRALLLALMNLMRELSGNMLSSAEIVISGGMEVVVALLGELVSEPRDPLINVCVEVLWNCLEHSQTMLEVGGPADGRTDLIERRRKANAMYALSTEEALVTLRDLLAALFETGHRARDKELRNEVLIVASFIARQRRSHAFFRTTGLLELLLTFATAAEKCDDGSGDTLNNPLPPPPADLHNFATVLPPDLELKRLLWALLSDLSREEPENLALVVESDLLEVLIMYLNVDLQLTPETAFATVSALAAASRRSAGPPADLLLDFTNGNGGGGGGGAGGGGSPGASPATSPGKPGNQQPSPKNLTQLATPSFLATNATDGNTPPPRPSTGESGGGGAAAAAAGGGGNGGNGDDLVGTGGLPSITPMVITRLPRTQLRVLQQQAMAVLLNLVLKAPDKFKRFAGHIIVLRFLDLCSKQGGESRSLVQGALMLMLCFVALPGLQDELGQLDAVRIMLARFNDQTAPASLRADAVCIMSKLCIGHDANQATFRQADGIVSLINQMEQYARGRAVAPREKKGGLAPGSFGLSGSATEKVSPLLVGVMDCLWNSVVGNGRSEARLLSTGGIDALLNMLEVCPILMRHQIAGLLADLCENALIVPYVKAWRSDRTMKTAVELLMHIFEDEEVRLQYSRPDGIIRNLWEPLRKHASEQSATLNGGGGGGAAPGEVEEDPNATPPALLGVPAGPGGPVLLGGEASMSMASSTAGGNHGAGAQVDDAGGSPGGIKSIGGAGSQNGGEGGAPSGKAFARLNSALQQSASHKAEKALRKAIETQDLRAKITAIVTRIGFEFAAEGLAAPERATLLMAQHYLQFRSGEAWVSVRRELLGDGVKPIAADSFLLESKIESVFDAARQVECNQMALANESREEAKEKEQAFFETVKLQRDQEIRMEQIKRSAMVPKSLKKKQAEAEAQMKMLEDSMVDAGPEADSSMSLSVI